MTSGGMPGAQDVQDGHLSGNDERSRWKRTPSRPMRKNNARLCHCQAARLLPGCHTYGTLWQDHPCIRQLCMGHEHVNGAEAYACTDTELKSLAGTPTTGFDPLALRRTWAYLFAINISYHWSSSKQEAGFHDCGPHAACRSSMPVVCKVDTQPAVRMQTCQVRRSQVPVQLARRPLCPSREGRPVWKRCNPNPPVPAV